MTDTELNEAMAGLMPVIARASKSVSNQWPGVIDTDDAQQSISLHLWERPSSLLKLWEMESRAQYRAVVGIGHQIASQERTDYDYYRGAYKYSVDEVKKLLAKNVLTEDVEGFNDSVLDLMEALETLATKSPQYVDAVTSRYADGEVPKSGSADSKQLSRAIEALVDAMNKSNKRRYATRDDGIGTRGQVSTDDNYEGGEFDFESFANTQGIGWG